MTFLVALLLLCIVVVGIGLSYHSDMDFAAEERIAYGAFFGLLAYVISALFATRLFGFNGGAVVAAIVLALAGSGFGWRSHGREFLADLDDLGVRLRSGPRSVGNHALFGLFLVPSWIWMIRILTIAYRTSNGGIGSGNLAIFSDWQAHSTYTASFAYANNVGFDLPTATGWALAYHNGINYFAATLIPAGATLQAALTISSGFCAFFFPVAMYLAGYRLFNSRMVAGLGTVIFFLFGGWGWTHLISTNQHSVPTDPASPVLANLVDNGLAPLGALPTRYTRFYEAGYWLENPVVGHLYPQRPTLIGFPITIIVVMLLWSAYQRRSTQTFLFAGVIVGVMPFFHLFGWGTPLALGGLWAVAAQFEDRTFVRPRDLTRFLAIAAGGLAMLVVLLLVVSLPWAVGLTGVVVFGAALFAQREDLQWRPEWLWFLAPAIGLSIIVAYFMLPPDSNPDYAFSWAIRAIQGGEIDAATGLRRLTNPDGSPLDIGLVTLLWENAKFWMKNFGFFVPLLIGAQVLALRGVRTIMPWRMAWATLPIWLWFIVPNFTRLHPWEGNNTHYLIFVVLLGAFPVAALLLHVMRNYSVLGMLVPFVVFSMILAGALDIMSSGDTDTEQWDLLTAADVVMADWVKENTDNDAVFVVADDNTHPMSSLTGRPIVAGFNGWIFDLGIPDWWERTLNSQRILQGDPETPNLIDQYNVDYVVIGPRERNVKQANETYWDDNGSIVYDFGGYRIYEVS